MVSFLLFIPIFQENIVPASLKMAIALILALIPGGHLYFEVLDGAQKMPIGSNSYSLIVMKETIIGVVFSFLIGLAFRVPAMVGDFIDNQRGTAISQTYNPALGDQSSELANLLSQFFITWFMTVGGMLTMSSVLFLSYKVMPITSFYLNVQNFDMQLFLEIIAQYFKLFIIMVAPFMLGMLLLEFGMGLMNRFANQLNVFFLAQPLKSLLSLFIMTIFLALMVRIFQGADQMFQPIRTFLNAIAHKGGG